MEAKTGRSPMDAQAGTAAQGRAARWITRVLIVAGVVALAACDSASVGPVCGNGVLETGEQCDGAQLGSGCWSLGYEAGEA